MSRHIYRALLLTVLGLSLATSGTVRASVVRALELADLVARAEHVVLARAESRSSRWDQDHRYIVTDVKLRVQQSVKGGMKQSAVVTATRLGGSVDGLGLTVPGAASFALGERAIVFLRTVNVPGELHVVGMSQGVLPVQRQNGGTMVMPGGGGAALVTPTSGGQLADAPDALLHPQPLTDVLERIRRLSVQPKAN